MPPISPDEWIGPPEARGKIAPRRLGPRPGGQIVWDGNVAFQQRFPIARVESDPGTWVVTMGPLTIVGASTKASIAPNQLLEGFLEWGHAGVSFTAALDWRQGYAFQITGSSVDISLRSQQAALTPPARFTASALIQPGAASVPQMCRPTKTVETALIAAGGTVRVDVPAFAYAYRIMSVGGTLNASLFVQQETATAGVVSLDEMVGGSSVNMRRGPDYSQPWPLHWAARQLSILNGGAASQNYAVEFSLSFG